MTGVDVEHTKALIAEAIREVPLSRRRAITLDPPIAFKLVQQADALVAAVERVQALADDLESRADAIEEANPTRTTQIALHRQHAAMIRQALETL